jgi:hypothetical protein
LLISLGKLKVVKLTHKLTHELAHAPAAGVCLFRLLLLLPKKKTVSSQGRPHSRTQHMNIFNNSLPRLLLLSFYKRSLIRTDTYTYAGRRER